MKKSGFIPDSLSIKDIWERVEPGTNSPSNVFIMVSKVESKAMPR